MPFTMPFTAPFTVPFRRPSHLASVPDAQQAPNLRRTPRIQRPRAAGLAAALLLGVGVPALVASPAAAHSALLSSDPNAGAMLSVAPSTVTLVFNESVSPQFIDGAVTVGTGAPTPVTATVEGSQVILEVPQLLSDRGAGASWKVDYRVVSADGHPISDSLTFEVAAAAAPNPASTSGSVGEESSSPAPSGSASSAAETSTPSSAPESAGAPDPGVSGPEGTSTVALATGSAAGAGVIAGVVVVIVLRRRGRR